MAPHSLFAILLRSPWWISLVIAVLFVALAQALLPPDWRLLGMTAGIPFFGLSLVALRRQWRAPSERQVQAVGQAVAAMSWTQFSHVLAQGFERQGYTVERLSGPADLLLRRQGRQTVVSARRWKAARHGEDAVQALYQAARSRDASASIYVALGELSPQARRLAARYQVQLLQGPALAQLLRGVPGACA